MAHRCLLSAVDHSKPGHIKVILEVPGDEERQTRVLAMPPRARTIFADIPRQMHQSEQMLRSPLAHASIFAETLQGLSNVLLQAGYQVIIGHTDHSPDAFFLVGTHHTDAVRDMLARAEIPVVQSWAWIDTPIDQLVDFSNQAALAEAVAYARRRGYARPTFVGSLRAGGDRARTDGRLPRGRGAALPRL